MRLGVMYSQVVKRDGHYCVHDSLGRYLEILVRRFHSMVLYAPVRRGGFPFPWQYPVSFPNVKVQTCEGYLGAKDAMCSSLAVVQSMRRLCLRDIDVLLLRYPMPFSHVLASRARKAGIPVVWHVVGNPIRCARFSPRHGPLEQLVGSFFLRSEERIARRQMRGCLIFVNGSELASRFQNVKDAEIAPVQTSCLASGDFYERTDLSFRSPIRLLTVSYFEPIKGIEFVLEAVRRLVDDGLEIEYELVGDGPWRSAVEAVVDRMALRDKVMFSGFCHQGPELHERYCAADIFLLGSLSEGTPRVLGEAMARGLPSIATRVGGVPDIIRDGVNGLLVEPGSATEIADAIRRLCQNEPLRRHLVEGGYQYAKANTAEQFVNSLADRIIARASRRPSPP